MQILQKTQKTTLLHSLCMSFLFFSVVAIRLAQKGAVANIGPQSLTSFEATQRLCEQLDVAQVTIQASGLSALISPCSNELILYIGPAELRGELRVVVLKCGAEQAKKVM